MRPYGNVHLTVSLPHFDGPFALLLDLIRKNEYPMENLPIAEITGKFLVFAQEVRSLDIDLGSEFMETASWLVLLKSRSMLPSESAVEARNELRIAVQKYELDRDTLDHTKVKLGGMRSKRQTVPAAAAARAKLVEESDEEPEPTASDVVKRVRRAIATARAAASFSMGEARSATVEEQMEWVLANADQFPAETVFSTDLWFEAQTSLAARVSLLLALLELGRSGEVLLHQRRDLGPVLMKRQSKNEGRELETVHALAV